MAAVELVRLLESEMEPETPLGIAEIRLCRPERRFCRKVPRRLSLVDRGLCDLFTELCGGLAPWPLLMWGPVGSGKTFAALAFTDIVRCSWFCTLEEAVDSVMARQPCWRRPPSPFDDNCLLVVDELGERTNVGDLHYTTLKAMLDHQEFCHRRVGIYMSNLPPKELVELFDDRIVSRLTAGSVFKLTGTDRRQTRPGDK